MTLTDIIPSIASYCEQHGISTSTFGRKAVNDGKLVTRLEEGKTITLDTLALISDQLSLPPSQSAWSNRLAERGAA